MSRNLNMSWRRVDVLPDEPTTWQHGAKRVYMVDDDFVVSHHRTWMPGVYDSFDAATEAFNYSDDQLSTFGKQLITLEMLRSLPPQPDNNHE